MIRTLVLAAIAAGSIGACDAQLLNVSAPLSPRPLPAGVSFPTIATSATAYPGCPTEPTTFGNVWTLDPVNGHTMSDYTNGANGAPLVTTIGGSSGQGTASHPWNSLQALWGVKISGIPSPSPGYSTVLLSTALNGSSAPIHPGDEVVLNTGNYGSIAGGDPSASGINNPALTIIAGSGQAPVLSTLTQSKGGGFVWKNIKIQSQNDGGNGALVLVQDGNDGVPNSNYILDGMDISSAPVTTTDTWSQAQWRSLARPGVIFQASDAEMALSCVSIVNSQVYGTHEHNGASIEALAGKALVQNNEVHHFATSAIFYLGNNALGRNYVHDLVETGEGDQHIALQEVASPIFGATGANFVSNVFVFGNKAIESIDPLQKFQGALHGILNDNADITNLVITDNLIAGNGCSGIEMGNIHNALIANNSLMGACAFIKIVIAHGGSTGPEGLGPSNVTAVNNIAPNLTWAGVNVQFYDNIDTSTSGTGFVYSAWGGTGNLVFGFNNTGSVVPASTAASAWCSGAGPFCAMSAGETNILDGLGASNEFTSVPASGSFPMSPQPNWTLKAGSPAKTMGGVSFLPPIPDYNGVTFAPPYSIGALN